MTDGRVTEAQLAELKDRHPCDQVAAQWVALRKNGRKLIGPCPVCSDDRQSRASTKFECDADGWVCAACPDGGDVIKLVQKVNGLDFRGAVDWLGGPREVDAEQSARIEAAAKAKAARRERDSEFYRQRERREMYGLWGDGKPIAGSAAADYLARRHVRAPAAGPLSLRALPSLGYFERVGTPSRLDVIERSPAMLAPIVNPAGRFAGLHMTYLDQAGFKLAIVHPETGEPLPAKKVRGSMMGNRIELVPCPEPRLLVLGEGIETVLSVWRAYVEAGRDLTGVAFWSAISLGNLAGKASKTVKHPTLKTDTGRARLVPGPDPDLESVAIVIPDSVTEVIILGDGDSDPFTTGMAVCRAAARLARPGRAVRVAWSPAPDDFNDLAPDWPRIMALMDAAAPPALPASSAAAATDDARRKPRGRKSPPADQAGAAQSSPEKKPSVSDTTPAPPDEAKKSEILTIVEREIADDVIRQASELDHSDTDNAERLRLYYGDDLTVMAQSGVPTGGQYLAWSGRHWDLDGGNSLANIIAQRVGDLIKREADLMAATPREQRAIDAGAKARVELQTLDSSGERSEESAKRRAALQDTMEIGMEAMAALGTRKVARRKHGVASKNGGKIEAMLRALSHHLRRPPDDFNADAMLVATLSHTLRFIRTVDADGKVTVELEAQASHDRADLITALIPHVYDPAATCPNFLANMERFQPDPDQRRTVQQFTGLGLLGMPIQKVMFHVGTGGNFKSTFLEVITRVLGDSFAIGLPAESVSGRDDRAAGQASPDLERTFGKRMLRVLELPEGQPLQPGTVKKLTGGEKWPVRTLFKGYYEFQPRAKTHMSGNSDPHFDGSDGGMKRRLLIVEWPVSLTAAEQRDFEEVVTEFMAEAPGILNWLIDGALDYLKHGLVIAQSIVDRTQAQIEEMDPIGEFFKDCVEVDKGGPGVQARPMYQAYRAWSEANAKRVRSENKFGRDMKKLCRRDDRGAVHVYADVRLHDVPAGALDEARHSHRRDHTESSQDSDPDAPIPF